MDSVYVPHATTPTLWPATCFAHRDDADPRAGKGIGSAPDGTSTPELTRSPSSYSLRSRAPQGPSEPSPDNQSSQAHTGGTVVRDSKHTRIFPEGVHAASNDAFCMDKAAGNVAGQRQQQQPHVTGVRRSSPSDHRGLVLPPFQSLDLLLVMRSVQVDDADLQVVLGPVGRLGYMRNRRNFRLACYFWPATVPAPTSAPASPGGGKAAPAAAEVSGRAAGSAPVTAEVAGGAVTLSMMRSGSPPGNIVISGSSQTEQEVGLRTNVPVGAGTLAAAAVTGTSCAVLPGADSRPVLSALMHRSRSVAAACLLSHAFSVASQLSLDPDLDLDLDLEVDLDTGSRHSQPGDQADMVNVPPQPLQKQRMQQGPKQTQKQHNQQRQLPREQESGPDASTAVRAPSCDLSMVARTSVLTRIATSRDAAEAGSHVSDTNEGVSDAEGRDSGLRAGGGVRVFHSPAAKPASPFREAATGDKPPLDPFGNSATATLSALAPAGSQSTGSPAQRVGAGSRKLLCRRAEAEGLRTAPVPVPARSRDNDGVQADQTAGVDHRKEAASQVDGPQRQQAIAEDGGSADAAAGPAVEGTRCDGGAGVRVLERPKGIVVLVHGHGAYLCWDFLRTECPGSLPRYDGSWVEHLNRQGYAVCGIDLQGAGRSEGCRCYIEKFEHYVQDVIDFTVAFQRREQQQRPPAASPQKQQQRQQQSPSRQHAQESEQPGHQELRPNFPHSIELGDANARLPVDVSKLPRDGASDESGGGDDCGGSGVDAIVPGFPSDPEVAPRFVMGLSLGGGIATHIMHYTGTSLFSGAVLMSPMISLQGMASRGPNPLLRLVAAALNVLYPHLPLVRGEPNRVFPLIQQLWDSDPSCFKQGTRVRNALEYLRACQQLCAELHLTDFPFLVFHSSRDRWTDAHGSRALFEQNRSPDKTLVAVDHMFHVLTKEDGWWDVLTEAVRWLDAHASGGSVSSSSVKSGNG